MVSFTIAADRPSAPARTDGDGDPLPPGAVTRLGSTRWRLPYDSRYFILSPDGRTLAVTTGHHTTEMIDARTGRRLHRLGAPSFFNFGPRQPAAFSPDGKAIAYLEAVESQQTLRLRIRIRNLADKRELSIVYRTKDNYDPVLPLEQKKGAQTLDRGEYISALSFSPDGNSIAAAVRFHIKIATEKGKLLRDVDENLVRRWDVSTGKELRVCGHHAKTISAVFYSADGKGITTASEDGTVRFWDTATGKENRRRWKADRPLFCAASSPEGKWFAAGSNKMVLLWDTATGELRHRLPMPTEEVQSIAFTPDGKLLATSGGTALRLWEPASAKLVREAPALPSPIAAFAFSADGKKLFLGLMEEQVVRRLEAETLKPSEDLHGHARPISYLAFSADGQQILTSATYDDLCHWDTRTGRPRLIRAEDKQWFERTWLTASLGRNTLWLSHGIVVESTHMRISILSTVTRRVVAGKRRGTRRPRWKKSRKVEISGSVLSWSADGKRLLIAQEKNKRNKLIVLDRESGKRLRELPQKDGKKCASLSPDGRTLALAAEDELVFLEVDSGRSRRYGFKTCDTAFLSSTLQFTPDSSRIVYFGGGVKARIVSVRDGRLLGTIASEDQDLIVGLALSADGKLCVCDMSNLHALWEVATGQRIRSLTGSSCLFSPDNRLLAIQNEDGLCLHDLFSGKRIRTCNDPVGIASDGHYLFSPDGNRLATASLDTTILLWDTIRPETIGKPPPLDAKTLQRLWKNLQTREAPTAYEAMGRLSADPQHTLPFLRKRLRKIPAVDENRLRQWIADLDSTSFAKREAASLELSRLGPLAERALRKALAESPTLELRLRLTQLLQPFEGEKSNLSAEELAHIRAIQVLERIGKTEARQLLKNLAEGAEGLARTRDAQDALQRMQQGRPSRARSAAE